MDQPLIYSILSGETTYAEWDFLSRTLEQTQTCSQELMLFIDRHRGAFWDKKFIDVALDYRQYELAAQLIMRISLISASVHSSGLKPITCPGVFADQFHANMLYKKETAHYFLIKLQNIREGLELESDLTALEKIAHLIKLLRSFSDEAEVSKKPGI